MPKYVPVRMATRLKLCTGELTHHSQWLCVGIAPPNDWSFEASYSTGPRQQPQCSPAISFSCKLNTKSPFRYEQAAWSRYPNSYLAAEIGESVQFAVVGAITLPSYAVSWASLLEKSPGGGSACTTHHDFLRLRE